MKLKNKKTGEIVEFRYLQTDHVAPLVLTTYENDKPMMYSYNSLAELNEEWEDYEEPNLVPDQIFLKGSRACIDYKSIEAGRKAVETLKAWKRLKDKGFSFEGYDDGYKHDFNSGHIEFYVENDGGVLKDLDLLFSQEDD